jgi:hypothetical protein
MSDTDTPSGGTPAPESVQQTLPAVPATPGVSMADVQRLLAEERTKIQTTLQADFEAKQAQREAALRAEFAAGKAGKGKPAPKVDPPADETPALITPPKLEEDPAYQALQTRLAEMAAKQAETEKQVKSEQGKREKAEEQARETERFQALFAALTDLENPSRTDPEGGQIAAKFILSQQKITRSQQTGTYFVEVRDPTTGEAKTVALKEWVQQWGQTNEGRRFRPALPSGAGTTQGFGAGTAPGQTKRPLNDDEALAAARDHDRRRRAQMGRSPLN